MTRLFGCLLIASAAALAGIGRAAALRERCRDLSELGLALALLRGEICDRLAPMPELAERLSHEGPARCQKLFLELSDSLPELGERDFAQLWSAAVKNSGLRLNRDELANLNSLGLTLGRAPAPRQGEAIARCLRYMEGASEAARREAVEKGRLTTGLGLALGAMAAILLY